MEIMAWVYDQHFRRLVEMPFTEDAMDKIASGTDSAGFYRSDQFDRTWKDWTRDGTIHSDYVWVKPQIRHPMREEDFSSGGIKC